MTKKYILGKDNVVDNLTTNYTDVPLSAKQGKVLNDSKQVNQIVDTITLTTDGWNSTTKRQTVSIGGLNNYCTVYVSPVESYRLNYIRYGVHATSQGTGGLTFECNSVPTVNLQVNIVIFDIKLSNFTDFRAGLSSGQICIGYTKNGVAVSFPNTYNYEQLSPVITTNTSAISTAQYLEIGAGVSSLSSMSNSLKELILHDISGIDSFSCRNFSNLTDVVIENCGFTDMSYTFYGCSSLINAPEIPNGVTNMDSTFEECRALVNTTVIPNSVTNMGSTFNNCISLINAPKISNSVTNLENTFYNCHLLVTAPEIPNSVTNMDSTFYNCTYLVNTKEIPNSVTNMSNTFYGCTSLKIVKFTHTTPPTYDNTLYGCSALTTIYVPSSALDTWKNTIGWSDFASKMVGY